MARAKITLKGSLSHTSKGRRFRKDFPQIITSPAEIEYYKTQPGFVVEMLKSVPKQATPQPKSKARAPLPEYSRDKLKGMKKMSLLAVARGKGIELVGDEKKADIIESVLEAQEAGEEKS